MIVTDETVALIKRWEGLKLKAYQDQAGVWTIGYGHSERAPLPPTPKAGMEISEAEAEAILQADLELFGKKLEVMLPKDLPPNVFGAVLSLAYNIGLHAFEGSTCRRRLMAGDIKGAAEALTWWNKVTIRGEKVVSKGLVTRRAAEKSFMLRKAESVKEQEMVGLGTGGLVTRIVLYVLSGIFANEAFESIAGLDIDTTTRTITINYEVLVNVLLGGGALGGALSWRSIASRLGGKT